MFSKLKELFTDATTGQLSHTKLWSNVGSGSAVGVFIQQGIAGKLTEGVWLVFLGVLCGTAVGSKIVSMKYGVKPDDTGDAK